MVHFDANWNDISEPQRENIVLIKYVKIESRFNKQMLHSNAIWKAFCEISRENKDSVANVLKM